MATDSDPREELRRLQAEMEAMRLRQEQLLAQLSGSGAIALGEGAVAAGAGGVAIGGDVHGNVYAGPPPKDDAEAVLIYRRVVAQQTSQLPLRGVDVNAADPTAAQKQLGLANVYVDLDTRTQVELTKEEKKKRERESGVPGQRETRPLGALKALIANRQMVLLGDPGGGKSTFVNHVAFCLASYALEPEAKWIAHLPNWPPSEAGLLPVVIILRDFARQLPDPLPKRAEPFHLWNFIAEWLKSKNLSEAGVVLQRHLQAGTALVLLDGLDEVPTLAQRVFVRDAVLAFIHRYERSRFLVTCRVLSYQPPAKKGDPDLRLPDLPSLELAPFDEARIDRFVGAWYGELARLGVVRAEDTTTLTRQLQSAIRRPDLWRLAGNPLLLTVMALVHTHKGRLPDARALLYEETIDILLWRWEQVKGGEDVPRLRQLLLEADRTEVDLKRVLWQLAYEAHAQIGDDGDQDRLADIGEARLLKTLAALKDLNWAQHIIETMRLRAGLLLERAPEVFTFPHRTFQEYLAGAHLTTLDFAREAGQLAGQGAQWREAILLAVGRLVYLSGEVTRPLALVGELCPSQAKDDAASWHKAWLAGDALVEIGPKRVADSALGRDLAERVSQRLVALIEGAKLPPRERAAAGNTLARVGDPRPEVMTIDAMPFCFVPRGNFLMGEGRDRDADYHVHSALDYDYWMSRHPITNAQYAAFVEAGGYRERRYWIEAEAASIWRQGQIHLEWAKEVRERPAGVGDPFNLPNHPVVGITWYEALAFTRWLTDTWRAQRRLPDRCEVRLPSEAEWEKAARGGVEIPVSPIIGRVTVPPKITQRRNELPKRAYPWGDEIDPNCANYTVTQFESTSAIGSTSAVGAFELGASPYGVLDLSGNVWEWTRSLFQDYPYDSKDGREDLSSADDRVLRGGVFGSNDRYVRCAYRGGNGPYSRGGYYGFRIVVSPL